MLCFPHREADPRMSEEQVEHIYKKGQSLRTEFAELFTGNTLLIRACKLHLIISMHYIMAMCK